MKTNSKAVEDSVLSAVKAAPKPLDIDQLCERLDWSRRDILNACQVLICAGELKPVSVSTEGSDREGE